MNRTLLCMYHCTLKQFFLKDKRPCEEFPLTRKSKVESWLENNIKKMVKASTYSTRMHSSRMRTARSLTVSHQKNHACPPRSNHACPPRATTHTPPQSNHAHPPRATTHPPGATTHAPPGSNHAPPREQPHMPPPGSNHACPPQEQPCMSPWEQQRTPPPRGQTDTCKNITFANFVCGR